MAFEQVEHDIETIRAEIARVAPRFEGLPVVRLGEGMDSLAVLLGDDYVFGFAKHADAALGLERQAAILPHLAPTLPLEVPRLEYSGRTLANGLPFVGYPLIRGEPLDRASFEGLGPAAREGVFRDLAGFLGALHAFPVERALALGAAPPGSEAGSLGVAPFGSRADYGEALLRARGEVFPLLGGEARREVDSRLSAFLEDDGHFARPPVLLHADLWPEHVLYSTDLGRITGVIDFADVSIGDADYDLAFLATRLGPGFLDGLLRHLDHPDPARLPAKLDALALFNAIDDATIGLERGDRDLTGSALAYIADRCVASWPAGRGLR